MGSTATDATQSTAVAAATSHYHHHQQFIATATASSSSASASNRNTVQQQETTAAIMDELAALVRTEIPEGRQSLRDSYTNLERVAEYCEDTYYRSDNKKLALEETKNYTTQSLASVAYQINTLAYNYLQLLDLQSQQLAEMESQMNHIAQTVSIHKEKVARREIGVLTANKVNSRQYKIVAPLNPEKPIKYVRKPIDYSVLDDVGHGLAQHLKGGGPKHRGSSAGGSLQSGSAASSASAAAAAAASMMAGGRDVGPPPTTKPPTPPQTSRSGQMAAGGMGTMGKAAGNTGTLGKRAGEYRTPPVVIPPQVPSHYAPNYPMGHARRPLPTTAAAAAAAAGAGGGPAERAAGYSTLPMQQQQQGQQQQQQVYAKQQQQQQQLPPPPPANVPYEEHHRMPPPPSPLTVLHEMPGHIGMHTLGRGASAGGGHHGHHGQHGHHGSQHSHHTPGGGQSQLGGGAGGGRPGSQSPPLPPPPPPDEDGNQNFGRPRTTQGALAPIVPDDHNLPGWVPKNYIEKVVAIYDYYADKDDELSFQESSVLYVLKKNDDGWWEGVMDGVTGLFPGNYVEPCV